MKTLLNPSDRNKLPNWRTQLKRVGWALIVIGLIDIAYMVYCIVYRLGYASSLNIFAVLAGVYLVRGSLRTANVVRWFSAFILSGVVGFLILLPFYEPWGLWVARFHQAPSETLVTIVVTLVVFGVIAWVCRELSSEEIAQAIQDAGIRMRPLSAALLAGTGIVVFVGGMLFFMLNGQDARRAISLATKIDGPNYRYTVTAISISDGYVRADVTAYRSNDIRSEHVEFNE